MAIKKIYWTFRQYYTNKWVRYNPSYFLNKQYQDYLEAGLTKTLDTIIPENRYTAELAPWIKKMTRFIIWEYDEQYIDPTNFSNNIKNVWAQFNISMFDTVDDTITWIKDNTDLKEDSDTAWKFEIYPESKDEDWNTIPAKYLIIE